MILKTVATVLTVYGIETQRSSNDRSLNLPQLQQYLPFTVLKRRIGTIVKIRPMLQQYLPFTVLKQYKSFLVKLGLFSCNSTYRLRYWNSYAFLYKILIYSWVATVLTVYGIETIWILCVLSIIWRLQQYLPFTVLKLWIEFRHKLSKCCVATVLTVYGIETCHQKRKLSYYLPLYCCNSTYRLRYWNFRCSITENSPVILWLQQYLPFTIYDEDIHKSLVIVFVPEKLNQWNIFFSFVIFNNIV